MKARWSLRVRIFGAVILAALAPQILVIAWSQLDRGVPGELWHLTLDATDEAAKVVAASSSPSEGVVESMARSRHVRVRIFDKDDVATVDLDADDPDDAMLPVESFLFGAQADATYQTIEERMPPFATRIQVTTAREKGQFIGCFFDAIVICEGLRQVTDASGHAWLVYVDKTRARAVQDIYGLRHRLLRLALVTVPLSLLIGAWAARRVSLPIERLRVQALANARSAKPGVELPEQADEVGDLAASFNTVLATLDRRRVENEALVADIVHEMKSPVAAVRAAAEALESPDAPERSRRIARALLDSAGKLDSIVSQYLDLARVDAGMPREPRKVVDLNALAEARLERARDDARYSGAKTKLVREGSAAVAGVESRLAAAVAELLDNALSFASDGEVLVTVGRAGQRAFIRVEDSGPGISEEDMPHVFERFFTTRGEKRGSGLGLALVRAVAEAHGGEVVVQNRPEGGARFELRLPAEA